jgi:hypothetical protein
MRNHIAADEFRADLADDWKTRPAECTALFIHAIHSHLMLLQEERAGVNIAVPEEDVRKALVQG